VRRAPRRPRVDPALILLPDLFMIGYVRGSLLGAYAYDAGHSYPAPALVALIGAGDRHPLLLAVGLLWLAHIGLDRVLSYGLKYDSAARRVRPQGRVGNYSVGRKAQDRGTAAAAVSARMSSFAASCWPPAARTCCCTSGATQPSKADETRRPGSSARGDFEVLHRRG